MTYTCAPPGSGLRMALDRDLDGVFDSDERDAGTDPANAGSLVGACSDGIDNDLDGAIDLADAACTSAALDIENPECSDGVDNDGDGAIDGLDAHCSDASDRFEVAAKRRRCGLGFEGALALLSVALLRARRRRSFLNFRL